MPWIEKVTAARARAHKEELIHMGYLRIKCYYCGGTWEVYHRDLHSRYKKARECPHCFQKIDEQTWDRQIFPAYNALDDANRELFKDHLGHHVPLFEVSYESNTIFKNAKNWPSYSDDDDSSDIG